MTRTKLAYLRNVFTNALCNGVGYGGGGELKFVHVFENWLQGGG